MVKRVFDFVCSFIGLVILFPFFLVIGVLVKLDSKGPVFYLQQRVGMGMKPFKLFKFRTMRVDADQYNTITVGARDPRITTIGFYLRKYKADEFPQLINVLLGSMSLVGPRPELKKFVDLYSEEQKRVFSVKPGITDLASINFRSENEMLEGKTDPLDFYVKEIMPEKLRLNLLYMENQSFLTDIGIILKTIFLVIVGK